VLSFYCLCPHPYSRPSAFGPAIPSLFELVQERSLTKIICIPRENCIVTNIFVGNLSYQTSQEDLHAAFAAYGGVERVSIVTDRDTGQPRGFAFVEMTEDKDAQAAIAQLNGTELHGRVLNVNEARPRPAGGGGGGFGGRRHDSGGGGRRGARW